jgi:transposase-like protein
MKSRSTFLSFHQQFDTEEKCLNYLAEQKASKGYKCLQCGYKKHYSGKTRHWRKCQICDYDESATAHTLFHKCKIPLVKAFWMVYMISTLKKGLSTCEIKRQLKITQKTAWFWKRKIQQAMKSTESHLLSGVVEVDEMAVGGPEEGKPGRSKGKKKVVGIAIEIGEDRKGRPCIKRAYGRLVDSSSANDLKEFLTRTVSPDAIVKTDGWKAYNKATEKRIHVVEKSNNGKNFKLLHYHIMNLKGWIRGIHHHVSKKHMQAYMDEAHYRFNRRNSKKDISNYTLNRMVNQPWLSYKMVIREASM